ncbi:hypothetical protein [Oryza sativa Japonica Group]|uniref:Uncharacterized protein n=1 Tax=Oryza sativa subsp. japonica TaxID=39947 RepID=Q5N7C9_ORYSJ|nr:hypothetical protein [Oryza sativa Japonica Group]BAD82629.1 hypothetical protein [Oryza sativa Japonica Group]
MLTVAGDGNRRRGKRRRTGYRTAASTEGDGERVERGGANERKGKRKEGRILTGEYGGRSGG